MKNTSIEQEVKADIVHGFFLSYIVVFIIVVIKDYLIKNYDDFFVEFIALFFSLYGMWYYKKFQKLKESSYLALAIGALTIIALTYNSDFGNYTAIFMVVFALSFFFLLEYKEALAFATVYYIVEIILMCIIGSTTQYHPLLNNIDSLINLTLAVFFVMMFGFYYHFTIRRSYIALEKSNRQKEVLIKEVHHRVKNNLNVIISMLSIQADSNYNSAKEALLNSRDRINTIALVHDTLYKSEDLELIHIDKYMQNLIQNIQQIYDPKKKVKINFNVSELTLELNKALFIGLILNEIIVNSFKHAFKSTKKPSIDIIFIKTRESYVFNISDNGQGLQDSSIIKEQKYIGSQFVNIALNQVEGTSRVYNRDGLHYEIRLPL